MAGDNKTIGKFHLDGIPPAPRGMPQVEVSFDIDANGILHVGAKDLGTGKEQKITITASSGLDKNEVDKMVHDAEAHAAEDQKRRDEVEARNQGDSLAYQVEKTLKEQGDKVAADKKAKVEEAVKRLRDAVKDGDADAIKAAMDAVNAEMQAVSADLYAKAKASSPGTPPPGGSEPGGPDAGASQDAGTKEDVIDADFTMVDDEKKKKG